MIDELSSKDFVFATEEISRYTQVGISPTTVKHREDNNFTQTLSIGCHPWRGCATIYIYHYFSVCQFLGGVR